MNSIEKKIISRLKEGMTQKEISEDFAQRGISPNSVSSIEKILHKLRKKHGAKSMFHLAVKLQRKHRLRRWLIRKLNLILI